MNAFVIAQIEVKDPDAYEEYKRLAQSALAEHGGQYIIRGGEMEALEGDPPGGRMVMVEFGSIEAARKYYFSESYGLARAARQGAAKCSIFIVRGIS